MPMQRACLAVLGGVLELERQGKSLGRLNLAKVTRGSQDKAVAKYRGLASFGLVTYLTIDAIALIVDRLIESRHLALYYRGGFHLVRITETGRLALALMELDLREGAL